MKNIICLSALALSLAVSACHDNRKAKNYNDKTLVDDEALAFIKTATEAGLTEVKAANTAKAKSSNPRVIKFADMMIADHMQANEELKKIADKKYVNTPMSVNQEHMMKIDSVGKLSGAEFDKAYMQMMVMDHEKVVKLFQDSNSNTSATIDNYINKYLPKLKMHLDSAKAISASLK
jgi:putative membrane protein